MPRTQGAPSSKKHKRSKAPQAPETPDEFLALGVEHEESAEKWRAGDAAKSVRFFNRALEVYEAGLNSYPGSFDLSYNRARVQFELTQYPALLAEVSIPKLDLLRAALVSHRQSIAIEPDNADALFNTAQVLVAIAEDLQDVESFNWSQSPEGQSSQATHLREAISVFHRCLELQEARFEQQEAEFAKLQASFAAEEDDDNGGVPLEPANVGKSSLEAIDERSGPENDAEAEDDGAWASVVEPVTKASLVDCILAILRALTSLAVIDLEERAVSMAEIEQSASSIIQIKLPKYLDEQSALETQSEVAIAIAQTKAAILETKFDEDQIDAAIFDSELKQSFESVHDAAKQSAEWLCAYAEALVDFVEAVSKVPTSATIRWSRLTKALDMFTQASKRPDAKHLPLIHVSRGNIELLRYQLAHDPELPEGIRTEKMLKMLLSNAQTFYRGAVNVANAEAQRPNPLALASAMVRKAVAAALIEDDPAPLMELESTFLDGPAIAREMDIMEAEGVISKAMLDALRDLM